METTKSKKKIDSDIRRHIDDLLYIEKCVSDRIHAEIGEFLMGRGQTAEELGDRLKYVIEERIDCMKADEKRVQKGEKGDIKFSGATLLSKEDYVKYEKRIPILCDTWWLKTPCEFIKERVMIVRDAHIWEDGYFVLNTNAGVRPALVISQMGCYKVGDTVSFGGISFTIISSKYALCDQVIGYGAFRKVKNADNVSDYNASDIKKYVDLWFANAQKALLAK